MKLQKIACALIVCCCAIPSFASKVVLGKLGQALKSTSIHASPSSRSRVYYRVRPYEYLVLRTSRSRSWTKVLLQNGMFGYVRQDAVVDLPYEVTSDPSKAVPRSPTLPSRSGSLGEALSDYSLRFLGTPYKWGGNDLSKGIDCSGFVKKLYGAIGVSLPRTAAQQVNVGQPIRRLEDLRPGDRLYFWSSKRGKVGHTGIYIGNCYFVHASSGHGQVSRDYLGSPKWLKILYAARR